MFWGKPRISLEEALRSIESTSEGLKISFSRSHEKGSQTVSSPVYAVPAKDIKGELNLGFYVERELLFVPTGFTLTNNFQTTYHHFGGEEGEFIENSPRRKFLYLPLCQTQVKQDVDRSGVDDNDVSKKVEVLTPYGIAGLSSYPLVLLEESDEGILEHFFFKSGSRDLFFAGRLTAMERGEEYLTSLKRGIYHPPEEERRAEENDVGLPTANVIDFRKYPRKREEE